MATIKALTKIYCKKERRSGVALIIALGILSLLVLLIFAYTISMRVERMATRNARDAENASLYLGAAETIAFEHIQKLTIGRTYPCEPWAISRFSDSNNQDLQSFTNGIFTVSPGEIIQNFSNPFNDSLTNLLPESVHEAARSLKCGWCSINITNKYITDDETSAGRISFLIADLSGMLDVHHMTTNQILAASQTDNCDFFFDNLDQQRPYILPSELKGNKAIYTTDGKYENIDLEFLSALNCFSYDPNPYLMPFNSTILGERGSVILTNKINLSSLTNFFSCANEKKLDLRKYHDDSISADAKNFLYQISNTLYLAYEDDSDPLSYKKIFWNILNDIDSDSYPQTDTDHPWLDDYGFEAYPMFSEFVLTNSYEKIEAISKIVPDCPACDIYTNSQTYHFSAEVWYPFFTTNKAIENVDIEISLIKSCQIKNTLHCEDISFTNNVNISGSPEFNIAESKPFNFEYKCDHVVISSNDTEITRHTVTNILPIGMCSNIPTEIRYIWNGPTTKWKTWASLSSESYSVKTNFCDILNSIDFGGQVVHNDDSESNLLQRRHILDESPGPTCDTNTIDSVWLRNESKCFSLSVEDPRFNGRYDYWINAPETLGKINDSSVFRPDNIIYFQGLPLIHHNFLPKNVGELGYVNNGNKWQSINLFAEPGAMIPDLFTTGGPAFSSNICEKTAFSERGRIHALTHFPASMRAMFADTLFNTNRFSEESLGFNKFAGSFTETLGVLTNVLSESRLFSLRYLTDHNSLWIACPFGSFMTSISSNAINTTSNTYDWRNCELWKALSKDLGLSLDMLEAPTETNSSSIIQSNNLPGIDLFEDLFRDLPERVTFRQNIFMVFLRAQTLSAASRVTADVSEVLILFRDSYTGEISIIRRLRQ